MSPQRAAGRQSDSAATKGAPLQTGLRSSPVRSVTKSSSGRCSDDSVRVVGIKRTSGNSSEPLECNLRSRSPWSARHMSYNRQTRVHGSEIILNPDIWNPRMPFFLEIGGVRKAQRGASRRRYSRRSISTPPDAQAETSLSRSLFAASFRPHVIVSGATGDFLCMNRQRLGRTPPTTTTCSQKTNQLTSQGTAPDFVRRSPCNSWLDAHTGAHSFEVVVSDRLPEVSNQWGIVRAVSIRSSQPGPEN